VRAAGQIPAAATPVVKAEGCFAARLPHAAVVVMCRVVLSTTQQLPSSSGGGVALSQVPPRRQLQQLSGAPDGHWTECTSSTSLGDFLATKTDIVQDVCCNEGHRRLLRQGASSDGQCPGMPTVCSATCAPVFISYVDSCVARFIPTGMYDSLKPLYNDCVAAAPGCTRTPPYRLGSL
jgi:hypothetical protein